MTLQPPPLRVPPAPDSRQEDILDAVRNAFVEKGFDGASMQDLARAAGMSVGNFYRYFQSKDAIIEAIAMRELADVEREFSIIIGSDDPMAALRRVVSEHIHGTCSSDGGLWAEITAAARRKPAIGAVLEQLEMGIAGYLIEVFAKVTKRSLADATARYRGHASLVMLLVSGSGMRLPAVAATDDDLNRLILRTIDRTLDEIANDVVKG
jgi:AcrR family transcriptional regulator